MKRLSSSDSLGGFMSISHNSTGEEHHVYSREFESMMMVEGIDEEGCVEESAGGHIMPEKKRRLCIDQVKALEKNFELDNKLEPDRKIKLAQQLGLQPRQVAVWFQNRRARSKTKQLELDYAILKANYDALKLNFDNLQLQNQSLLHELGELKSALQKDKDERDVSVKAVDDNEDDDAIVEYEDAETELDFQTLNNNGLMALFTSDEQLKDGSSDDSDSSGILNEENGGLQFIKIEEHNFFGGDDSCNTFFSDHQPPSLQWDCTEQWIN